MLDSPERLAIFVPSLRGGGAERAMLKLARGLAGCSYTVDLVLAQAEGPYLAEMPRSVRLIDLEASRILTSLPALVRYLRRERPDAMLSALCHANVLALWARRLAGVPRRVVISGRIVLSREARSAPSRRARLMPQLVRCFYPWADGIVAVSEDVADDMAHITGISRESIQVIYNPVITPDLQEKARVPLEHPWFAPGEPPVVLGVGRLTAQKDYPTLIRAFDRVRRVHPARLLILGEGEDRSKLEGLVRQLGLDRDVSLPGFVLNPYAYMAQASLFVLSSRWEGLPAVLIEALYCGVPVIATDCPGGPREILKDGQYGQLVSVGDVDALAKAIGTGLQSGTRCPPCKSWQPFEVKTVVSQYIRVLLGSW